MWHFGFDRLCDAASCDCLEASVGSERLVLRTYNIYLPLYPSLSSPPGRLDAAATGVLKMLHPILVSDHVPHLSLVMVT